MLRFVMAVLFSLMPGAALADGIIIPEPWVELAIARHLVKVRIQDQAVVTEIDQSFLNLGRAGEVEGTYMFPIPERAAISAFSMFVDGKALAAELLPADEARRIYTEIVRQRIDPALLEYAGRGAYRARIFPIVAGVEKRVQLSYSEVIRELNEVRKYVYPLNTEKFSARPLKVVSVQVEIASEDPIKNVYSPSHPIEVQRTDDHHVTVVYSDEETTPNTDFVLYYSVSRDDVGINALTYREAGQDGFYMLLAAPRVEVQADQAAKKRIALVLDRSGSMRGEKMAQAREAMKFVLRNLNSQDVFNIFDYSTLSASFTPDMLPATSENTSTAIAYVNMLEAGGGTNIHEALVAALNQLKGDDYLNMVLFMTDGIATVGVTENEEILKEVQTRNALAARIFAFGVGFDVNTHLLDLLGSQNRGTSAYVKPGEDIEAEVSAFYTQVSHPVLSELKLTYDGISISDMYPRVLPDLFKGSQIVQFGRYVGSGTAPIELSGTANGERMTFSRQVEFPGEAAEHNFLPRLWATRKIGFLLNQIRLNGEVKELVEEIVSLSRTYGIITPYTSFLIVEDTPPGPFALPTGFADQQGADAVAASEATRDLAGAVAAPSPNVVSREGGVRTVGTKTFYLRDGVWKDAGYTEGEPVIEYRFGSNRYFKLLDQFPDMGPYLALGTDVIVKNRGVVYRIWERINSLDKHRIDFSGDGRVDFSDFLLFAQGYRKAEGESGYNAAYDLDGSKYVDFQDFMIFSSLYGMQ